MFYFVPFIPVPHYSKILHNMASLNHAHANYNSSRATTAEQAKDELMQEPVLWKLLLLTAIAYLMWTDKVTIVLGPVISSDATEEIEGARTRASLFDLSPSKRKTGVEMPPDALSNATLAIDPGFARRNKLKKAEMEKRLLKCRDYVEQHAPLAVAEMQKFGVPASITLAQGLLESDAGESKLVQATNNHFGIKCFSKRCKRGHCANFSDDTHKDFFVKYANAEGSYRAHSQFLKKSKRYRQLFEFEKTDYRNWARGLAEAGYATDGKYGEKLIAIIQTLRLDRYDGA